MHCNLNAETQRKGETLGAAAPAAPASPRVALGIRPEDLTLASEAAVEGQSVVSGTVVLVERLGGTSHIHFDAGATRLMAAVSRDDLPAPGAPVHVIVPPERVHLFDDSGAALARI